MTNDRRKAVVVLSGGQDSTTCLFWARRAYDDVHAIVFDYGQRHRVEIDSAFEVARMAGVPCTLKKVTGLLESSSPLTSSAPLETYPDFKTMDKVIGNRVELTFVPMRNTFFLTVAANFAISIGSRTLVTGVCQQDNANYPDCRAGFIQALQKAFSESLGEAFEIMTPLMYLTKAESIKLAQMLPGCMEALAYSHTCYAGSVPPCGKCHACVLRAEGFRQAGVDDPLVARFK